MTKFGLSLSSRLLLMLSVLAVTSLSSAAAPDPVELAAKIDKHLSARWEAEKVKPASKTDDAMFVRRVSLDLVGRIPTVAEVREFLDDKAIDKQTKLVAGLLDSGPHFRHMALFWRREWIPQIDTPQFANLAEDFDVWLAGRLRDGVPADRIVRELLTTSKTKTESGATPATFLIAAEFKPDNLAANTSRAFLGINLDCAQCHDHPFARWTREQFWETAAFFARSPTATNGDKVKFEVTIPSTKKVVVPKLLTGQQPQWPGTLIGDTGRALLADWVTAKDNPYFAKNVVNRVWANLFGTGLVEPLDDLSGDNSGSHPELLDELAKEFVDSGFDLKYLTTAVVLTKAYQLSSVMPGDINPRLFGRAAVRGLTGEQLYDSLRVAAGLPPERDDLASVTAIRDRKRFADKFRVERGGTAQRSILQSLSLMNGKLTVDLTTVETTPMLRAVADAPFLNTKAKIESLYLATLGRQPTDEESAPLQKYVEKGGADGDSKKALADIFWALINSSEFNTNH
jgi:hypothetical protein